MHATTSNTFHIAIGGAGRRHKHLSQTAQNTGTMPVTSRSPIQKLGANARRCGRQEVSSLAVAMINPWKAHMARVAKKISSFLSREKAPSAEAEQMKKLLHNAVRLIAYHEDNEKARLELKASVADHCTSEDFDQMFPPSLRYVSMAWEEEFEEKALAELVSARK